jgi:hypothetical protein
MYDLKTDMVKLEHNLKADMVQFEHKFCSKLDILETKFDSAMSANKNFASGAILTVIAFFMLLWL